MVKLGVNELNIYEKINRNAFKDAISYEMAIKRFKEKKFDVDDLIMISRYTYNFCEDSLFDDSYYDFLLRECGYEEYKDRKYEEDDYTDYIDVIKLLNLRLSGYSIGNKIEKNPIPQEDKLKLLNEFNSNSSLMTLTTISDVRRQFLDGYRGNFNRSANLENNTTKTFPLGDNNYTNKNTESVFMSYKHDGWNITAYYIPGRKKIAFAHTRGRDGAEVKDCTFLLEDILPELEVNENTKVVMEVVIDRNNMNYLKSKYIDKSWVNIRSSVSTFIAGHVDEADYKCITPICFNIISKSTENMTLWHKYKYLSDNGFNIPYFIFGDVNQIENMINYMDKNYRENYSKQWECDGLVIGVDFIRWDTNNSGRYICSGTSLCAYKGGTWDSEVLETEIEYIYFGRSRKNLTPKAKLKPVKSRSGSMISNVSLNNLNLIRSYWLMPGDRIKVKYHSQQIVLFLDKVSGITREEYLEKYKDELLKR